MRKASAPGPDASLPIIFLIEAWLWDKLEPIVARVVRLHSAQAHEGGVRGLHPRPVARRNVAAVSCCRSWLLIPFKFAEFWLLPQRPVVLGPRYAACSVAKLFFVGTTAFVFDVTRDKLLQLDWFRGLYNYVIWLRDAADTLIRPIKRRVLRRLRLFMPRTLRPRDPPDDAHSPPDAHADRRRKSATDP